MSMASLLLWSCAEDLDIREGVLSNSGDISLTLVIPEPVVQEIGTRSWEQPDYNTFEVYAFNSNGGFTRAEKNYTNGILKVKAVEGTTRYEVVAFKDDKITNYDPSKSPAQNINSGLANDVIWGSVTTSEVSGGSATVKMLRQTAKVEVSVKNGSSVTDSGNSFELQGFNVFGTPTAGTVGPLYSNYSAASTKVTSPTLPDNVDYSFQMEGGKPSTSYAFGTASVYVFESAADKGRIIIKGKFNGEEGYYPLIFAERSGSGYAENPGDFTYKSLPVLRNHFYKVEIDYVRAKGYDTLEEAFEAKPDNRLTALITDTDENVSDIIAGRDYSLGVQQPEEFPAWGPDNGNTRAVVYVVTTYTGSPRLKFAENIDWIDVEGNVDSWKCTETTMNIDGKQEKAWKYEMPVVVKYSTDQVNKREGVIKVTSGELEREVVIRQGTYDAFRSGRRAVYVAGLSDLGEISNSYYAGFKDNNGKDLVKYFDWLDGELQGVKPEENRGVVRNMGMHFPAVPSYNIIYYVEKLSTDQGSPTVTGGYSCTTVTIQSKQFYRITQPVLSSASINTYALTIKEGTTSVNYQIYQTGFVHFLRTYDVDNYEVPVASLAKRGWYYYELVSKDGLYFLDRNLGASSNSAYISTNAGRESDNKAIGGYFKIAEKKYPNQILEKMTTVESDKTIVNSGLANLFSFVVISQNELEKLGVENYNIGGGSTVASIKNVSGNVDANTVFIPHGGYYDDVDHKGEVYANIWTRSLHCYNQGFDSYHSPEFGYWYRFLNGYASSTQANLIKNFSQMRFANGASGTEPTSGTPFRYMPLRLVWVGINGNAGGQVPSQTPNDHFQRNDVVKIIWHNDWDGQRCQYLHVYEDGGDDLDGGWPGFIGKIHPTYNAYYYYDLTITKTSYNKDTRIMVIWTNNSGTQSKERSFTFSDVTKISDGNYEVWLSEKPF